MDTIWTMIAAFLVFFMNLASPWWSLVSAGPRTPSTSFKNFVVFAVSSLAFLVLGFGLMFGDGNALRPQGPLLPTWGRQQLGIGRRLQGCVPSPQLDGVPLWAKFFFQLVFAGTAARSYRPWPSGSSSKAFVIFTLFMVGVVYPSAASDLGGGWLASKGFLDFAGSTVVHHRRLGGPGGHHHARAPDRQIQAGRQGEHNPRPQHDLGRHRRVRPVVRMVRVQPRLRRGRALHRPYRHHYQHRRCGRDRRL